MILKLPYKTKQFFFVLAKWSLVLSALYFVYFKLTTNEKLNVDLFISFLNKKQLFSFKNSVILILLTGFNWFFEISKWHVLVNSIKKTSFTEAFTQCLGAFTASIVTPARIGEYGAKAIYFESKYRKRVLLLNFIGNAMQMGVTLLFGIAGLVVIKSQLNLKLNLLANSILLCFITALSLFMFYILKKNHYKINGFPLVKIKKFIQDLDRYSKLVPLALSILRYVLFSFQFFFLLSLYNGSLNYFEVISYITSLYLLSSILPTFFILDVLVKGSIGIYLFSFININEITVLMVTTIMWILNVAIPTLIGSFCILNFKLPKNEL